MAIFFGIEKITSTIFLTIEGTGLSDFEHLVPKFV